MAEMIVHTARYRKTAQTSGTRNGCKVLTEPFFLDEDEWIAIPPDRPRNVQRGCTYDTESGTGAALWHAVQERLNRRLPADTVQEPRFLVSPRLREDFVNGRAYYAHNGERIKNLPEVFADQPAREFLDWHNTQVYVG